VGGDDLSLQTARVTERWEMARAAQGFAECLDPVFFEGPLEFRHQRPFDPHLGIAPMEFVLSVSTPLF